MTDSRPKPVVLCILDGWGHRDVAENNAILQADTPVFDRLSATGPRALLETSGDDVGLPRGQMGNSEVGHQNLGAGRVVMQDLPRIDAAVADGSLSAMPALADVAARVKAKGGVCHVMGLLSPGGVHAHQDHIAALAGALDAMGVPVRIHAFLDGRDTPPKSAGDAMEAFLASIRDLADCRVATVTGRFYAMDRDQRWDRVARAQALLVDARGEAAATAAEAIRAAYDRGETDEFASPTVIADYAGMADGDGLVMANFRADRAREILATLVDPDFDGFPVGRRVTFAARLGMVSYSEALDARLEALFPPKLPEDTLPEVVSRAGLRQLRIAETEKYAHVTFFLNGGSERVFEGEERILVPSPRVATYDLQPEMSAPEVTDRLVEAIRSGGFDLIVVNYANPDMVGHTGDLAAARAAVETVDACLGRLEAALIEAGGTMLVTADHGNVEMMADPASGQAHTAHTTNPVPLLLVNPPGALALGNGRLADVAPTLLELLALKAPAAMTGESLLQAPGPREEVMESRAAG